MNKPLSGIFATLLIFSFAAISAAADSDKTTSDKTTSDKTTTDKSANVKSVSDKSANVKISSDKAANVKTTNDKSTEPQLAAKSLQPITGAFGIQLGKKFDASMVAKVLHKQELTYSGPGGTKLKGQLLRIEPAKPDKRFQQYSLKTTDKGVIYAIQGDYQYKEAKPDKATPDEAKPEGKGKGLGKPGNKKQPKVMQSTCKAAVKTMAGELESRYGKPRGQGWDGLWFTFRQFSDTSDKGLRLYGHRCRSGMYSIIYTDNTVQRGTVSGKAGTLPRKSVPSDNVSVPGS